MYYKPDGATGPTYCIEYSELLEFYQEAIEWSSEVFEENILDILHHACIVMWFKQRGQDAISDTGIVHEIVHFLIGQKKEKDYDISIKDLQSLYKEQCKLCP